MKSMKNKVSDMKKTTNWKLTINMICKQEKVTERTEKSAVLWKTDEKADYSYLLKYIQRLKMCMNMYKRFVFLYNMFSLSRLLVNLKDSCFGLLFFFFSENGTFLPWNPFTDLSLRSDYVFSSFMVYFSYFSVF